MKTTRTQLWVVAVSCLLAACLCACAPKRPPVVLPEWEPLPTVTWESDGERVCTADYDALIKREQLRELRESTYREMLKALGALDDPKSISLQKQTGATQVPMVTDWTGINVIGIQ